MHPAVVKGIPVTYGVTIQTLDRPEGNGVTMVLVDAENALAAEREALRIAERRYGCTVLVDHAVPWTVPNPAA